MKMADVKVNVQGVDKPVVCKCWYNMRKKQFTLTAELTEYGIPLVTMIEERLQDAEQRMCFELAKKLSVAQEERKVISYRLSGEYVTEPNTCALRGGFHDGVSFVGVLRNKRDSDRSITLSWHVLLEVRSSNSANPRYYFCLDGYKRGSEVPLEHNLCIVPYSEALERYLKDVSNSITDLARTIAVVMNDSGFLRKVEEGLY